MSVPMNAPVSLQVTESSHIGHARRTAAELARRLGFDETLTSRTEIVVTEFANNLLQHAREGEMLLVPLRGQGIEILSLDRGPGMNLAVSIKDGFSTRDTFGIGLGAVQRMTSFFDGYSYSDGSVLLARLWASAPCPAPPAWPEIGAISLPCLGETDCGDAWASAAIGGKHRFMVVDGLGHGPLAATAARQAVQAFHENAPQDLPRVFDAMHQALRSTRGAAAAVAEIDFTAQIVRYVGVGNIAGVVIAEQGPRSMVSQNGTLGLQVRKIQEFAYPFPPDSLLIMHSDGLATRWDLQRYPGLRHKHSELIAGVLYRDHKRPKDDVMVMVAREAQKDDALA
jgi:anti-sigma regulatory factor (Ser/Thr protein kinase)